jgi:hypothetical protein
MSGAEFERYMAKVFKALGYDATLVGGAGDQGVDLVLRQGAEVVAVQCKNYRQPVGNRPIQEVYAGARHHGVDQAWVIAPAGYTRGAVDLARSTGVVLYDRAGIEDLVKQADSQRVATAGRKDFDREIYQTFLNIYSEMLDRLESHRIVRSRYASEISQSPEVRDQYEHTRHSLYRYIGGLLQDLDALEGRNPEWGTDELTARRRRLEARQRKLEQRAKEQGILVEPANVQSLGAEGFPKEAAKVSITPRTSGEPSAPATDSPAKRSYAVGDTAILNTGDRLTLHSYKSPVPPPGYKKPKAGYEFSVLDVEVCASSDSGGLKYINPFNYVFQMPDNTRLEPEEQHAERELGHTNLLPDDPVRGLIFYQTPKGEKPKFVIFTQGSFDSVQIVKWAV